MQRRPWLAVDGLVVRSDGTVVLVRRGKPPFEGLWALPGGFVEYGERVEEAVVREVREETGLATEVAALIGVYSDPSRDPRWHVVSVAFLLKEVGGALHADTDAAAVAAFPLDRIPHPLAFDHDKILEDGLRVLSRLGGPRKLYG